MSIKMYDYTIVVNSENNVAQDSEDLYEVINKRLMFDSVFM